MPFKYKKICFAAYSNKKGGFPHDFDEKPPVKGIETNL